MSTKIIICDENSQQIFAKLEDDRIVELWIERQENESILGNIYIGKVQNMVNNIQAAFVKVNENVTGYLPLESNQKKAVHQQDELLVQIERDQVKKKQPVLTRNITLTGRYVVLTKGKLQCAVSSKIQSKEERSRLKQIAASYENEHYGFIIRTNASNQPEEVIRQEIEELVNEYETILQKAQHSKCFSRLYKSPLPIFKRIRDCYSQDVEEIIVSSSDMYNSVLEYMSIYDSQIERRLRLDADESFPLNKKYGIDTCLTKALNKNVWLKSGGSLCIEPTEALTAIDVNTSKAIRSHKSKEETFYNVNCEAAREIAYQLRLRNISGLILVDFIDMQEEEHKEKLLTYFRELCNLDQVKTVVVDITPLGLVEVTRKKINKTLAEQWKDMNK